MVVCVALLMAAGAGCKTDADARAAAAQMMSTAHALAAYYTALDHVVAATEDSYQAQNALLGVPAEDLKTIHDELRQRAQLATAIGDLASLFDKITKTTAAKDASAAASKINGDIFTMRGLASNDMETQALTAAVKAIVGLIVEEKEVEAARDMAPLCHKLSVFFESERRIYDSLNKAYLTTAQSVALKMVDTDQVDASAVFGSALDPFGMKPALSSADTRHAMQPYLRAKINEGYADKLKDGQHATEAMSVALKEMDARVTLVANDKPMSLRNEPFSLSEVKDWVEEVTAQ